MNEGKKDRRDPIRTIKPRNFVAKNASSTTSGAGAHKDKKRAEKNGDIKHKKAEYAESYEDHLSQQLNELSIDALKNYKEKSQAWTDKEKENNPNTERGSEEWMKRVYRAQGRSTAQRKINRKEREMSEEFDSPEYNDEAGMANGNLITLARAVKGLLDTIEPGDNLPEWCQEKIAKSEMMLVTVWDYLLSQKEQGIDPKVDEASINEIKKGQKDSNGNTKCWTGYHAAGTKKGKNGKPVRNCVPNEGIEGWTHDSLAAQLFETENTYEDKLTNLLNKQLGK
jgi:hypothetical protein